MRPELELLEDRSLLATGWSGSNVSYSLEGLKPLGDIPLSVVREEARSAIKLWDAEITKIKLRQTTSLTAKVDFHVEPIDGVGGYWGYGMYPPDGRISIDPTEDWDLSMLRWIMIHEVGHALGLEHSSDTSDVMFPYYDYDDPIHSLSEGDVQAALAIYPTKTATTTTNTYQTYLDWYNSYLKWYNEVYLPWWYQTYS